MAKKTRVQVRRIYEDPSDGEGKRILVDRVWPRGVSKKEARLDEWLKDVAPSTKLRKWYAHDPDKFKDFAKKYRAELKDDDRAKAYQKLLSLAKDGPVTLLTAAKRDDISQARVLADRLNRAVSKK